MGLKEDDIVEAKTSGAYELPHTAACLIESQNLDCVVAIGCLIKGDTQHFEYICEAVTQGIMRLGLDTGVPVLFGVLTVNDEKQALARAGIETDGRKVSNHGVEWAQSAVVQANHKRKFGPKGIKTEANWIIPAAIVTAGAMIAFSLWKK